jgi:colanic acid biosynthesis glycosyl transferase WcaI
MKAANRILIVYHFFYPDDVISARHFSDFAEELAKRNWDVTVLTSNRFCRAPFKKILIKRETWKGVKIIRTYRPPFNQANVYPRIINAIWLAVAWTFKIIFMKRFDVVVLGTDPQFLYYITPIIKLFKMKSKIAYWGYDLYPEAIIMEKIKILSYIFRYSKSLTKFCYKFIDLMIDIGPCMKKRLFGYKHNAEAATLVPWALSEPIGIPVIDIETRLKLFGNAKLGVLYSGTIGSAHEFESFLMLAREIRRRNASVAFCFAGRGNRYDHLKKSVNEEDTNISFTGFADESELERRLGSADIHMLSLREGWEGIVLPSKFFGSLASGRPVLYSGAEKSAIKEWIETYKVGFYLSKNNINQIADKLISFTNDKNKILKMQHNAFCTYNEHFSKRVVMDKWSILLKNLIIAKMKR